MKPGTVLKIMLIVLLFAGCALAYYLAFNFAMCSG